MSVPQAPAPAKLVIGILMKEKALLPRVTEMLCERFGQMDMVSPWLPFDYTPYYEPEMGSPLFRRMLTFASLTEQHSLPEIKCFTNEIESEFSENGNRKINIDPGYMVRERFVLATGKNFTHRIYIGKGIYADLTLIYTKGAFQKLPWTYPDYADEKIRTHLELVRRKYINDLKQVS